MPGTLPLDPSGPRAYVAIQRSPTMSHSIRAEHPAFQGFSSSVNDAITQIPTGFQLQLTEAAAQYLKLRWKLEMSLRLGERAPITTSHTILDTRMKEELQRIAVSLAEAALNHRECDGFQMHWRNYYVPCLVRVSWDIAAYSYAVGGQDGGSPRKEESLRNAYPPIDAVVDVNTTIVDRSGKLLAWLMPELISESFQVRRISSVHSATTFSILHRTKHLC